MAKGNGCLKSTEQKSGNHGVSSIYRVIPIVGLVGSTVTDHRTSDTSQVGALRDQLDSDIDRFIGDGAYDSEGVFNNLIDKNDHQPELIVPPMDVAVISSDPEFKQRNNHILIH